MAETFVAMTVVALLICRVMRGIRMSEGHLRMRGLDPWVF